MDKDDILDSEASFLNWLTGQEYSFNYKQLAKVWSNYPVYQDKSKLSQLIESIISSQVTVLQSGTGSGKTVIAPKVMLRLLYNGGGSGRIAISNPKKTITQSNAEHAAKTLDVELGEEVGFAYRGASQGSQGHDTRLLFATDGYLVSSHREDPLFSSFNAIIIDEAHERTMQIDTLLYMLREALTKRPDFKVLILSATIDPKEFTHYFEKKDLTTSIVEVSGQANKPITQVFSTVPGTEQNYKELALKYLSQAMGHTAPGEDILYFVPTSGDAENGCIDISKACKGKSKMTLPKECEQLKCSPLYSKLSKEKQDDATSLAVQTPYDRRIIVATNLAESSLTLPSLTVVLESGLELQNFWVPENHSYRLKKSYITQAQVRQRMGRVGRVTPGTCYHLYTKEQMDNLPKFPSPSLLKQDITEDVLVMMRSNTLMGVKREFSQFMTPPSSNQLKVAVALLMTYGLIKKTDGDDAEITPAGNWLVYLMKRSQLDLWSSLLLMSGIAYDQLDTMIILTCVMEECNSDVTALFFNDKKAKEVLQDIDLHPTSGHLSTVRIFSALTDPSKRKQYHDSVKNMMIQKIETRISELRAKMQGLDQAIGEDIRQVGLFNIKKSDYSKEELAVISARMYHFATKENKYRYKSKFTIKPVQADVNYKLFKDDQTRNKSCVYEAVHLTDYSNTFKTVSFFNLDKLGQ